MTAPACRLPLTCPVVLDHAHDVVDERAPAADLGQPFLGGRHQAPPRSGYVTVGPPAGDVLVPVEVELLGREDALEAGQLLEGAVERVLRQVVGHGDVGVVRELQRHVERSAPYGLGELLAAARSPRRGSRTPPARPAGRCRCRAGGCRRRGNSAAVAARWSSIPGELVVGDLGRRHQRDVGRDPGRGLVAERGPVVLELGRPGLGDGDGDADRGHPSTLAGGRGHEAHPLVDVRERGLGDRARPPRHRAAARRSRWVRSSSSSRVRSRNGVTTSTTTSARSVLRAP